jgi:DNA-directed RNA polymerase specialized sigma subunit
MARLYVEHQGLIRLLGAKLTRRFPMVDSLDVFSCIDVAFLKSCRAFSPQHGKFSTIFTKFATGEIRHFIRDHNFVIAAPSKVRELSVPVRRLLANGHSLDEVAVILGVSKQDCKEAVMATAGLNHDIKGFELHECQRPGPLERLMEEEEAPAS